MRIACAGLFVFSILILPNCGFARGEANPSNQSSSDPCLQAGAVHLSAAQMRAHLFHTEPISPPALYCSLRIKTVLSFRVVTDQIGSVICIRANSGHPMIIGAAIDSVRRWKFRPMDVRGQRKPIFGTLILSVAGTEKGIKTRVLKAKPPQPK